MIDKTVATAAAAVADIRNGATVMIGGFGTAGMPSELIDALIDQGARELTIVNNNAGNGEVGLAALLKAKPAPTDKDIMDTMSGNLCRCGCYQRIEAAVRAAAKGA